MSEMPQEENLEAVYKEKTEIINQNNEGVNTRCISCKKEEGEFIGGMRRSMCKNCRTKNNTYLQKHARR